MKKKLMLLGAAVAVLAILLGVYAFMSSRHDKSGEKEETPALETLGENIADLDEVKKFTVENSEGKYTFTRKGGGWQAEGYDNQLDQNAVDKMAAIFTALYSEETVEEEPADLSKYGLDKPAATGTAEDITVKMGALTSDNKFRYVQVSGSNAVYMADAAFCDSLNYGLDDFIDKSIAKVNTDSIQEIEINVRDKEDIYVKYDPDNPIARDYAEANGLATLVMERPVENMLVYPYSLENSVLRNINNLNIADLVDPAPTDLSLFGLDKPQADIMVRDEENKITIKAGNMAPNKGVTEYIYVQINDRPEVFTMDYRSIEPFISVSIADFSEKFISLYQRSKVNAIEIKEGSGTYKIELKSEGENTFVQEDGVRRDRRNAYINGIAIDRDTFTDFYEQLIAIGFDNYDMNAKAEGTPIVTITFDLADGSRDIAEYYSYNSDFYVVKKGENTSMLVNKQTVAKVLNEAERLVNK